MLINREEVLSYTDGWLKKLNPFRNSYRKGIVHAIHNHNENLKSTTEKEICMKFADKLKERIKGLQSVEIQGKDMCPYSKIDGECRYINSDIGCSYCAREVTLKQIDEVLNEMDGE